jgi:hypothetical protein
VHGSDNVEDALRLRRVGEHFVGSTDRQQPPGWAIRRWMQAEYTKPPRAPLLDGRWGHPGRFGSRDNDVELADPTIEVGWFVGTRHQSYQAG